MSNLRIWYVSAYQFSIFPIHTWIIERFFSKLKAILSLKCHFIYVHFYSSRKNECKTHIKSSINTIECCIYIIYLHTNYDASIRHIYRLSWYSLMQGQYSRTHFNIIENIDSESQFNCGHGINFQNQWKAY